MLEDHKSNETSFGDMTICLKNLQDKKPDDLNLGLHAFCKYFRQTCFSGKHVLVTINCG